MVTVKVLAERGTLSVIPKGTFACAITCHCLIAVDNTKVLFKAANGDISPKDAFYQIEQNTAATVTGTVSSLKGMAIGSAIGMVLSGPVGAYVGGLIGGGVGYMAGSTVGRVVTKAYPKGS